VLVVDGGAPLRRAPVGGNLAAAAARNGWAGIVVNGRVRDVAGLNGEAGGNRAGHGPPNRPALRPPPRRIPGPPRRDTDLSRLPRFRFPLDRVGARRSARHVGSSVAGAIQPGFISGSKYLDPIRLL